VRAAPTLRDATWVGPRHVAEVGFTEWTADGMLRHPTFRRLRPDRTPAECEREAPIAPVVLTHPDRVLYPRDGITKRDVADYYARVAEPLLHALAGRPLALEHFTDGIDRPSWFEQTVRRPAPWMTVAELPSHGAGGGLARRLVADRPEVLDWFAQRSALTIHVWSARVTGIQNPDWVVFDLDPGEGHDFALVVEAALVLRRLFERLGLGSVPKTSGRRGLHVLVPLAPGHTHEAARRFATRIGAAVAGALPGVTVERSTARRRGRLYLDCLQNGPGKTIVAPYSPRARDGAPVSAPLAWAEVNGRLDPSRFTIRTMPRRLERVGDLFAPALHGGARLPAV
jgi:bifunctional non-homologous end joining protein LigD